MHTSMLALAVIYLRNHGKSSSLHISNLRSRARQDSRLSKFREDPIMTSLAFLEMFDVDVIKPLIQGCGAGAL